MRRFATIVAAAIAVVGPPAAGQTLDLSAPPPLPQLPEDNAATRLARTVQEEIRALEIEAKGVEGREATVLAARIALRRIAFDLLARGATEPLERSSTAMEGLRLADVRRSLDAALAREFARDAPPRPMRSRDRIERSLSRFAEIAPRAMAAPGLGGTEALDAALATALRPLVDAVAVMAGREGGESLGTGWPALGGKPLPPEARVSLPTGLPTGLAAVDAAFSEPATASVAGREDALRLAGSVATCAWLTDEGRAAIDSEIAATAGNVSDAEIRLMRARASLAATVETLGEEGRTRLVRLDAGLVALVERALIAPAADRERLGTDRLARGIARMAGPISLASTTGRLADGLPKDLRPAGRPLVDRAEKADRAALAGLADLLDREDALVDPAVSARLIAQRNARSDLDRLADVERLSRSIGGVRPQAADPVRRRLGRAARELADPARRERSVAAFEALATQVDRYLPLPFEAELRHETPEAIDLTGGDPAGLVAAIDLARANWADAWADGRSSGPEAARLHELWRLGRILATVATSSGTDRAEAGRLSNWGGFHATRATLGPALVDAIAQARLAAAAAIAPGPPANLAQELASLERDLPIWLLAGSLRTRLGPWLDDRPDAPLGVLAAVREPPEPQAFGIAFRGELATIARGVRELEELRRDGRTEDARSLHLALSAVAARLLGQLGEDGSAPLPSTPDLPAAEPDRPKTPGRPRTPPDASRRMDRR